MTTKHETLAGALAAAALNIKDPVKDAVNPHFKSKYVTLAGMLDAVRGVLAAEGVALVQESWTLDGSLCVETVLMHGATERRCGVLAIPCPAKPQEIGSAITYLRRYSLGAAVCIAPDDDDDGEVAQAAVTNPPRQRNPKDAPLRPPPDRRGDLRALLHAQGVATADQARAVLRHFNASSTVIDSLNAVEIGRIIEAIRALPDSVTVLDLIEKEAK